MAEVILRGLEGVAEPQGPAVDAAVGERHPGPHITRHRQGLHSVAVLGDAVASVAFSGVIIIVAGNYRSNSRWRTLLTNLFREAF